ncbi:hypothetical protein OOU_Y34scaffold00300g7 [Pyricularia oryzae Y34]|uniref:C2H2-type domain-containing protein n=1 Tax=Pyricularia oryzae (strain Y34) TaxID=1143189 RepID=A0AA97PNE6_PYRO3|nr:hypothetical protein OOU_Y34scaffold00300g7 [Pyricularia oryzae Y34]
MRTLDTGVRPYKCVLCGNTFSRSDLLKRHFQKCSIRRGNPTGASHLSYRKSPGSYHRHGMSVSSCQPRHTFECHQLSSSIPPRTQAESLRQDINTATSACVVPSMDRTVSDNSQHNIWNDGQADKTAVTPGTLKVQVDGLMGATAPSSADLYSTPPINKVVDLPPDLDPTQALSRS